MDKTLELIIAATVFVLVGSILMFMISGQGGDFEEFVDNESSSAQCSVWETQYRNSDCNDSDLQTKLTNQCGGTPSC